MSSKYDGKDMKFYLRRGKTELLMYDCQNGVTDGYHFVLTLCQSKNRRFYIGKAMMLLLILD
jgi:hypothetical protein